MMTNNVPLPSIVNYILKMSYMSVKFEQKIYTSSHSVFIENCQFYNTSSIWQEYF